MDLTVVGFARGTDGGKVVKVGDVRAAGTNGLVVAMDTANAGQGVDSQSLQA